MACRRPEPAEDLSFALLLTLERHSPLERAAFILHDVFDYGFTYIARALERSEAACRKLATRAGAHLRDSRPRGAIAPGSSNELAEKHAKLIAAFATATQSGDLDGLMQLLALDVRVNVDGGGKERAAAEVLIVEAPEGPVQTASFEIEGDRVRALYMECSNSCMCTLSSPG